MQCTDDDNPEIGEPNALSINEIDGLIKLAKIRKPDVFYDLGSGCGRVVRRIVQKTKIKKAVGIEVQFDRFAKSVSNAKRYLTKKERARTEFWCVPLEEHDLSDGTVFYSGHSRSTSEVQQFTDKLKQRNARIVTLDLPFIGYKSVDSITVSGTTLYLMQNPLSRYRTKSTSKWASVVLGKPDARIADVYKHYDNLLQERGFAKRERTKAINELRYIVADSFY